MHFSIDRLAKSISEFLARDFFESVAIFQAKNGCLRSEVKKMRHGRFIMFIMAYWWFLFDSIATSCFTWPSRDQKLGIFPGFIKNCWVLTQPQMPRYAKCWLFWGREAVRWKISTRSWGQWFWSPSYTGSIEICHQGIGIKLNHFRFLGVVKWDIMDISRYTMVYRSTFKKHFFS